MKQIKLTQMIEETEWSGFIQDTYGRKYRLQQQDGCMERQVIKITIPINDTMDANMHDEIPVEVNGDKMGVKFQVWLDADPEWPKFEDEWQHGLFWERNFYPDIQTVANDLHAKGLIGAGTYHINIDW